MDNLIQLFMFFSDWKTLRKIHEAIKNGDYEVADFGDSNRVDNHPHSDKEKTMLDKV